MVEYVVSFISFKRTVAYDMFCYLSVIPALHVFAFTSYVLIDIGMKVVIPVL